MHAADSAQYGDGKIVFQSRFMSTTVHPLARASSSALSSLPRFLRVQVIEVTVELVEAERRLNDARPELQLCSA
jgi:hypothetical protein